MEQDQQQQQNAYLQARPTMPVVELEQFMQMFSEIQERNFARLTNNFSDVLERSNGPRTISEVDQEDLVDQPTKKRKASATSVGADKSASEEEDVVPDQEAMRDEVQKLIQEDSESVQNDEVEDDSVDFLSPLLLSSQEEVADGVRPTLATAVDKIWDTQYIDSARKELFARYKRPKNCNSLVLHKCNPEIFYTLLSNKRSQDIKSQKVSSALLTAAHAITGIAEQLLTVRANKELSGSEVRKCLGPIVQSSMDSLAILALANQEVDRGRREDMKSTMSSTFPCSCSGCPSKLQTLVWR